MSDLSPLSGEERKLDFGAVRSVDDPNPTCGISERIWLLLFVARAASGRMTLNLVNSPLPAWRGARLAQELGIIRTRSGEVLEPVTRNVLVEKQDRQGDE
jgi:hypothetical protein